MFVFAGASTFAGAATFNSSVSIGNQSLLQYMFNSFTNPTGNPALKRPAVQINYNTLRFGGTYTPVMLYRSGQNGFEIPPIDKFINKTNVDRLKRFKTIRLPSSTIFNASFSYSSADVAAGKIYGSPVSETNGILKWMHQQK